MGKLKESINKIIDFIISPIMKNSLFYVSVFCLLSISVLFVKHHGSRLRIGLEFFFDVYLISAFITIIPTCCRKYIQWGVFILLAIVGIIDMACYKATGIALSPNIVTAWLQTNGKEAAEAILSYCTTSFIISPLILFLILPIGIYILKKIKFKFNRRLAMLLTLITIISAIYGLENKKYIYDTLKIKTDDTMVEVCNFKDISREYLPHYRLIYSLKEISRFSNMEQNLRKNIGTATVNSCSFESPLIVLIIGESYNRHHSSLYGYEKCTTPCQEQLQKEENLYSFTDVIASYNLTFKSFQNVLSLYSYGKPGNWYDYPLVTTLFKKAGYNVSFFSNQFCLDKKSSLSTFIDDVFINNEELSPQMFDNRNAKPRKYDLELIEEYNRYCNTDKNSPQFIIFHFIGVHSLFSERYPDGFAKFNKSDYDRKDLKEEEKEILAHYDNAIYYNDFVIDSIAKCFKEKEAIIIHAPDHGELVYDCGTLFGRNLQLEKEIVQPQYDIPFSIYCSPLYKEKHPDICEAIKNSTERPFMTDDLPHLLLHLAGIECPEYEEERNLIGENFNYNRKRVIRGEIDYDELCK